MEWMRQFLKNSANLPCAEMDLLVPLKRSQEYRAIRAKVADLKPLDAWQEYGIHYFLFGLRPEAESAPAPFALFAMAGGNIAPLSAMVITPGDTSSDVYVRNLHLLNHPLGMAPPTTIPN
jgi:hypothetical protein